MSLRSVESVYEFLVSMRDEAGKENQFDYDFGRREAYQHAIDLLSRVDSCDIAKLHEAVEKALNPKET